MDETKKENTEPKIDASNSLAPALVGAKVMIIDDDTFLLDMYGLKLKRCGAEVSAFTAAAEALDKLSEGLAPDIILCDIIMPQMDGFDFMRELRAKGYAPNATLVVLSNQGQEVDQEQAATFKVDDYIIKALLTPSEVVARLAAAYAKKGGAAAPAKP